MQRINALPGGEHFHGYADHEPPPNERVLKAHAESLIAR